MSENKPQWNFPLIRAGLGILGIVADVGKVTAEAATAGLTSYSQGIKKVTPPSIDLLPQTQPPQKQA